jgi:hypothetical protein
MAHWLRLQVANIASFIVFDVDKQYQKMQSIPKQTIAILRRTNQNQKGLRHSGERAEARTCRREPVDYCFGGNDQKGIEVGNDLDRLQPGPMLIL